MNTCDSFRRIIELENKRGYQNSAVIGGLDKFLLNWSKQMKSSIPNPILVHKFTKMCPPESGYQSMNYRQRQEWSDSLLKLLDEVEKSSQIEKSSNKRTPKKEKNFQKSDSNYSRMKVTTKVNSNNDRSLNLDQSVINIKGINQVLVKKFEKLGVKTIHDLLYFFPNRHLDYSQRTFVNRLIVGVENTIIANVWESREVQLGTRRSAEATVGDETGNVRIVWFNQPYMARTIKTGQRIIISGKVTIFAGMPVFESPEWEPYEDKDLIHTGRWVPVYPLTQGLGQRQIRRIIKPAIEQWCWRLEDFLPEDLRKRLKLLDLAVAIQQAHYPENQELINESRKRLAFDELFLLQLGVMDKKHTWQQSRPASALQIDRPELKFFLDSLPYNLTQAQTKSLQDILNDMNKTRPMSRLLQGEVGSGKTVVATAALILAVANGFQAAIMAPTEILAEQHFSTIRQLLSRVGEEEGDANIFKYSGFLKKELTIALLIGDLKLAKKQKVQERVSSGEVDIIIGTHALIQKDISYNKLGLAVVDEQHRFGVEQRSALREKGTNPHILVMTATPIPRTLALTLYGDLDLSVINEVPPGRQEIKTKWLKPEQRGSAYNFIRHQVQSGRQAFIICPFVEESEAIQAKAAVQEYEQLAEEVFSDLKLGLLHGRMNSQEKDRVMQQFSTGTLDILVSTPVVEVGIDVPNATVMLIESADRFGLSQLHQFRGRVGRGKEQSYCMLLADNPSLVGKQRLDLIEKVHNGFLLAEEDLKLRGPGEFFGTRQSGLPDLKMARLSDVALLELARIEAIKLFETDPGLNKIEHLLLARELSKIWSQDSTMLKT